MTLVTTESSTPGHELAPRRLDAAMSRADPIRPSVAATVALGSFIALFVGFAATSAGALPTVAPVVVRYAALAFHLAMFPLIAALPAPGWARLAGTGWLSVELMLDGAAINGAAHEEIWSLRLGAHLASGLSLVGVSLAARGALRVAGLVGGAWLGIYTLIAPFVPQPVMVPGMLVLGAWLALAVRETRAMERSPARAAPAGTAER